MSIPENRVLVVDDDEAIRESVKEFLETQDFEVETAENGEVALEKLKNFRAGVILLDMQMPLMDGWEFRDAQTKSPELSQIPVIVFCAGGKNMTPPGIETDYFLAKPIDIDDLLKTVTSAVNKLH